MELFKNFKELFLSVWDKGILGIDIFEILIGLGIFLIFLIFRGLISKLIIKKLEVISKRTTNKVEDAFVNSRKVLFRKYYKADEIVKTMRDVLNLAKAIK